MVASGVGPSAELEEHRWKWNVGGNPTGGPRTTRRRRADRSRGFSVRYASLNATRFAAGSRCRRAYMLMRWEWYIGRQLYLKHWMRTAGDATNALVCPLATRKLVLPQLELKMSSYSLRHELQANMSHCGRPETEMLSQRKTAGQGLGSRTTPPNWQALAGHMSGRRTYSCRLSQEPL